MSPLGWWFYLSVLLLIGELHCENCSYKDITLNYPNKCVRPVKNWTMPTIITVDFYLVSIVSLDMSLQTITTTGILRMYWKNEFISWDPNLHCKINKMYIKRDNFWQPDLYIYESIESEDKSQKNPFYRVDYNGNILDGRSLRTVAACNFNIFKFPFDRQVCNISFSSYIYTVEDIIMKPLGNSTMAFQKSKNQFMPKGDWNLISMTVSENDLIVSNANYSKVFYQFTIERVPQMYVLTFIIPVYFMVILDMISMFIPMDKADRLGFKITIVLGFSMLLLILNDLLPLSDTPPLLGIFCCACMATMVFSIIGSIGTSYIQNLYEAEGNVPCWVKTILLNRLSYILCFKRTLLLDVDSIGPQENSVCHKKGKITSELKVVDTEGQLDIPIEVKLLKRLFLAILKIHKSLIESKKKNIAKLQCSMAAKVVDRLILIVYTLLITVLSICVIVVWASKDF